MRWFKGFLLTLVALVSFGLSASSAVFVNSYRYTTGGGYSLPLSVFDGTNDWLLRNAALTGAVDGKQGTFSVWFTSADTAGGQVVIYSASSNGAFVGINTAGKIFVQAYTAASATILDMVSTITVDDGAIHHLYAAWDLAATTGQLRIDGVDRLTAGGTYTNSTIDYTPSVSPQHYIGGYSGGAFKLNGKLGQLYLNQVTYDATSTNYYSGGPVNFVGTGGAIFLNNVYSSFETNLGVGGNFTVNGALTDGGTQP